MKKVLVLKMPGVVELGREELKKVEGGWFLYFLAGAIGGGVVYDALKWAYKESLNSGYHYNGSVPGFGPR